MTSSIFGPAPKSRWEQAQDMARAVIGARTPEQAYRDMVRTQPGFADFVRANAGKSPWQVLAEAGRR